MSDETTTTSIAVLHTKVSSIQASMDKLTDAVSQLAKHSLRLDHVESSVEKLAAQLAGMEDRGRRATGNILLQVLQAGLAGLVGWALGHLKP